MITLPNDVPGRCLPRAQLELAPLRVTPQPRIAIISPAPLLIPFKPLWQNIAIILVKNTKYTPIEDQVRLLLLGNIPKMEVTDC